MSSGIQMPEDKTPAPPSAEVQALLDFIDANPSKRVTVAYANKTITEPGTFLDKEETKAGEPTLHAPSLDPSKTYVVIEVDPDAPAVFGCILHWVQAGYRVDSAGKLSSGSEPFIANYRGANPPPGSKPHRYIFAVYEQPAGFETAKFAPAGGAEFELMARIKTDLKQYTAKLGLGEVLAGNYHTAL